MNLFGRRQLCWNDKARQYVDLRKTIRLRTIEKQAQISQAVRAVAIAYGNNNPVSNPPSQEFQEFGKAEKAILLLTQSIQIVRLPFIQYSFERRQVVGHRL